MTPEDITGGPNGQPEKWTWRDRARGSVVSATVLDPGTEPLDGIEAFQTAYVPDRLLLSDGVDGGLLEGNYTRVREAAAVFGWGSCESASTEPR